MIHLIYGKSGTGKSDRIYHEMERAAVKKHVYLLVPDREAVAAESRSADLDGAERIDVITFSRLCENIFRTYGGICTDYIGKGAKKLIMRNVMQTLSPALKEYGNVRHFGIFEKMTELRTACYHDKITPFALEEAGKALGEDTPIGAKTSDLALIFTLYDKEISSRYEDPDGMIGNAYDLLKKNDFFAGCDVFIDSFVSFSVQQYDILEEIMRGADNVHITLPFVREEKDAPSLRNIADTERRLLRTAERAGKGVQIERTVHREYTRYASAELRFLAEHIARMGAKVEYTESPCDIRAVRAVNAFAEAEAAAIDICRAVREKGIRYRDMAVIVRDTAFYEGILDAVFRKYDIPFFLSSRKEISEKPLVKLIFAAFAATERGFRGTDVIAYIKTGYTGITADEVNLFENYIVKWNLRGKMMTSEEPLHMHPRGYGATFTEEDIEALRLLSDIRARVITPLKRFAAAEKTVKTVRERAALLFDFLSGLGVPETIAARAEEASARGEQAIAAENIQLWNVFCGALDQLVSSSGETEASVSEFSQMLSMVLQETDIGKIPTSVDEVTVSSAVQTLPGNHRYVYIIGAEEGNFPKRISEAGLFSEYEKSCLQRHGVDITDRMERTASDELYYFYRAATVPSERLYISYSHYGMDSEEHTPSVGFKRIAALFPKLAVEDFELSEPLECLESKKASFDKASTIKGELGRALREYYQDDEEYAAKMRYMHTPISAENCVLSPENAEKLFPGKLSTSYSRLEKFIKCRFAYFCEYELKLQNYEPTSFGAVDIGSFIHGVLEKTVRWIAEGGEGDIGETVRETARAYISDVFHMSPDAVPHRLEHLFSYLCNSAELFARKIKEEFAQSEFKPRDFELTIGKDGDAVAPLTLSGENVSVELRGKIDRVDTYEDGEGKLYVRVVDYKTGTKDFELENVRLGLDMQMLLYLFSIWENGEARYGAEPNPAAVLYSGIRPPNEEKQVGDNTDDLDIKIVNSGLFLKDEAILRAMEPLLAGNYIPVKESDLKEGGRKTKVKESLITAQSFAELKTEVTETVLKYAAELKKGVAYAKPIDAKGTSPCEYCKMKAVCRVEK
ncbi:MAG: PD-(D/E)XK nuclease family protein [Clostridia bacterium]|nr:PD-(D/E)XK nuclease family protein [Clostridia bacterium]